MIPLIVIAAFVVLPVLFALVFRVHALFVFTSIGAGYFLQFALSDDVDLALATVLQGSNAIVFARVTLLLLPLIATLLLLRKTAGKGALLQMLPLAFSGLLLAAVALPLLPVDLEQQVYATEFGAGIRSSTDLVIAAAVASNMIMTWTLFKSKHEHSKKH